MTLKLCLLRQVERKWEDEEQLDNKEEEGEFDNKEGDRGEAWLWQSRNFPKSGQSWGWISGPDKGDKGMRKYS